jgi:hypothetical protein
MNLINWFLNLFFNRLFMLLLAILAIIFIILGYVYENAVLEKIGYFFIGAFVGSVINFVNFIRVSKNNE